ncbi:trypsin-like peptidase domain-containing protein [Ruegeria sediminis]|uniref:Trypsin-like peptidase domain-containing protein n=1 Tax=Ruegeria sediminis TaxID=2583820 RepID=A0ABY2X0N2_9RHOB|nr:trypsin-like peptidase domain-containing protein [Ruegeria sediminis]TMV08796.1 trypsin-like peptidase domain-containing protein [Ruegeria sediminis]
MTAPTPSPCAAVLEHLTGRNRGHYSWITSDAMDIWLDGEDRLRVLLPGARLLEGQHVARILRDGEEFSVVSSDSSEIWVNRKKVEQAPLVQGDTIEFGETGPLSRFRVYDEDTEPKPTLVEIFGDALSYLRSSRKPLPRRLFRAVGGLAGRIARDATLLFRVGVLSALLALTVAVVAQFREDRSIRAQIESGRFQVEAVAAALTEAQREAIRPGDLAALQEELSARVSVQAERLQTLEARTGAAMRVVGAAAGSVAFIQGGYGLRHRESGQMLRQVVGVDGLPIRLPTGQPMLSLEGNGPVAEVQFNGTGFVLRDTGLIVTNRHVAVPWANKPGVQMGGEAMEPLMIRFIGYFPERIGPMDLSLVAASDTADVALLAPAEGVELPPGLPLAEELPVPGQEILVMGFPTGLMSLLAQSGEEFVEDLRERGETGFWQVAARLSEAGLMSPLSSRGIVGQATSAAVVYDAETTHGGSGGPVLDLKGQVVAVNAAIIPEFGGSNFGVPVAQVRHLLEVTAGTQ